ncbi:Smc-like protein Sph2 [Halorhabdus tiamatea SARL4B]|uniref:Kinetochore-Ndc80 complex, subunit Spc25 n=1 Tax=Halorhabdus tiamatea SARL4B TaxID=1033806 RepID=F7PHM7_9EURY|nr:archaea-specific SMC-related protein [Halorhabdus tiamatea]ERJ05591.1 Smc-like protein Sph2 [Halorhabdus tiamatea SARL4B]CCQ35016.1 kinetochore-Ndc80 complex, subunit Spc25 [Halorhabdus tiamatea SARL4B]
MVTTEQTRAEATVSVRNIGGIDEAIVDLEPGVNILAGRNATNRTSFLQAIMAALGSKDVTLKGDADEAEATLTIGGSTYRRQLHRRNDGVAFEGDPYLEDPELADLFAFLLDSNEARQAVTTEQNLRDVIMRPVDLEEIKAEISQLESEKNDIDEEIEAIEARKQTLPELESEKARLEDEIEETREALTAKEAEIDAADADVQTQRAEQQELEAKLDELREARNTLEDIRYDLDTERESVESLKQDRATLEEELAALPETPDDEIDRLDADISQLREQRRRLDSEINSLQSTVRFNEEMLDGERTDVYEAMTDDGHTTDDLLTDDVVCWTCGSTVPREQIEATLEELRDLRQDKLETKRELADELDDLKAEKERLEGQRTQRSEYERQLSEIEDELAQREDRIEALQERRTEMETEVKELQVAVEDRESEQFDEILELHQEANELEYKLGRLETDLEDVEDDIEAIESRIDEQSELEAERERITDELTDLRTRVDTLEEDAVEAFNDHMEEVLGALDYDNLDRIWIERVTREVREGRRKAIKTFFELHVVRSTPSGTTYEDTVDHLSESEREVTGLVFALAGYLVHEVYETVPFMLLDSLETIDSARIADLVEYFSEFADYLVVALLEEDANAVEGDHARIESI